MQLCGIAPWDRGRPARNVADAGGTPAVPGYSVSERSEPATHAEVEDRIAVLGVTAGHADALEQCRIAGRLIFAAAFTEDVSNLKIDGRATVDGVVDGHVGLRYLLGERR